MGKTSKIRVILAVNDFLIGGVQKLIIDLLNSFDHDRFEFHLVVLRLFPGKNTFYSAVPVGVHVWQTNFRSFRDAKEWCRLYRQIKEIRPDVILSNLFFCNTVIRILNFFLRTQVITVEHNTYIKKTRGQILTDRILAHFTYKIIAVSRTVAEFTSNQEKIPKCKFQIIHNGIDLNKIQQSLFRPTEDIRKTLSFSPADRIIINVGRLTWQKNQEKLIDAFAGFRKRNPAFKLIILGEGDLRDKLQKKVDTLSLDNSILLLGAKKNIVDYYRVCEFFVSSSIIEGFGIAHAEALTCGLPVLSTKTAGPDEMIQSGKNGYFIADPSAEAIERGLEKMVVDLKNFNKSYCMGSVAKYDIKKTTDSYQELFRQAIVG